MENFKPMKCRAILRKSPQAGQQCQNTARRGAWCVLHDPAIVLPRLYAKRARITNQLVLVETAIERAQMEAEPEFNPS